MKSLLYVCLLVAFASFTLGADDATPSYGAQGGTAAARAEIRKVLFMDYDQVNIPDNVKTKFGLSLLNLKVNKEEGILEADVWFKYAWKDSRLQWDNISTGVNVLRVGSDEIWKPDITLYNTANIGEMAKCWNSQPLIYASGDALWVPPCRISTYCNFTLDEFPLAEQKCTFKFGSWVYDGYILDLQLYDNTGKADIDYFASNKWNIVSNVAKREEKFYPCCAEPYPEITYTFGIQRKQKTNDKCKQ